ncbi:CD209 antigen-like protein E isoform X2 [Sparus aurata]|uniref:CD209 antigen-like protein E isoform X2 n=1 Tax=Sparus aurata TaxID=8175 RepID=UPI0011C19F01|nr:CD209 antigen-like protein E isoform X2 [Sparus aurata]
MVRFVYKEQSEITMDYANIPNTSAGRDALASCSGQDGGVTAAVPDSSGSKTPGKEASCKNLTDETDDLKRKLINYDNYFQQGWVYFHPSFYYISSIKKSWTDSRDDCLQRGADLIIINTKDEQEFARKFHALPWIGLTDRETKGMWKWVDGTPLTESYWSPGEPNAYRGKREDCVVFRSHDLENNWNDLPCEEHNFWICEKMIAL